MADYWGATADPNYGYSPYSGQLHYTRPKVSDVPFTALPGTPGAMSIEEIGRRVYNMHPERIAALADQWQNAATMMSSVRSFVLLQSNVLHERHWKSPAARDAFLKRGPGEALAYLDVWMDAAQNNVNALRHLVLVTQDARKAMDDLLRRYEQELRAAQNVSFGENLRSFLGSDVFSWDNAKQEEIRRDVDEVTRRFRQEAQGLAVKYGNQIADYVGTIASGVGPPVRPMNVVLNSPGAPGLGRLGQLPGAGAVLPPGIGGPGNGGLPGLPPGAPGPAPGAPGLPPGAPGPAPVLPPGSPGPAPVPPPGAPGPAPVLPPGSPGRPPGNPGLPPGAPQPVLPPGAQPVLPPGSPGAPGGLPPGGTILPPGGPATLPGQGRPPFVLPIPSGPARQPNPGQLSFGPRSPTPPPGTTAPPGRTLGRPIGPGTPPPVAFGPRDIRRAGPGQTGRPAPAAPVAGQSIRRPGALPPGQLGGPALYRPGPRPPAPGTPGRPAAGTSGAGAAGRATSEPPPTQPVRQTPGVTGQPGGRGRPADRLTGAGRPPAPGGGPFTGTPGTTAPRVLKNPASDNGRQRPGSRAELDPGAQARRPAGAGRNGTTPPVLGRPASSGDDAARRNVPAKRDRRATTGPDWFGVDQARADAATPVVDGPAAPLTGDAVSRLEEVPNGLRSRAGTWSDGPWGGEAELGARRMGGARRAGDEPGIVTDEQAFGVDTPGGGVVTGRRANPDEPDLPRAFRPRRD